MFFYIILSFLILVSLFLSAIFSATETAITGSSKTILHKLKLDGNKKAIKVIDLKKNKDLVLSTILLANNICNIFSSSLVTMLAIKFIGNEGVFYSTLIMTFIIVLFCEVFPKTYAIGNSEKIALKTVSSLLIVVNILKPITIFIRHSVNLIFTIFKIKLSDNLITSATEELRGAIEYHHYEGAFKKSDRDMLDRVLDLAETDVSEVMVHRKNVFSLNIDASNEEIVKEVLECNYSYLPLWEDNIDNFVAILDVKKLLKHFNLQEINLKSEKFIIRELADEPWFIPDTTSLKKQLEEFRSKKKYFAIVVDEYGTIQGIVTLKDILEEIVGRIEDGSNNHNYIKVLGKKSCYVDGSVTIRDVNRAMGWDILDENATTIAGLLIHNLERIPEKSESFIIDEIKFTVLSKKANHICRIKLSKISHK